MAIRCPPSITRDENGISKSFSSLIMMFILVYYILVQLKCNKILKELENDLEELPQYVEQ